MLIAVVIKLFSSLKCGKIKMNDSILNSDVRIIRHSIWRWFTPIALFLIFIEPLIKLLEDYWGIKNANEWIIVIFIFLAILISSLHTLLSRVSGLTIVYEWNIKQTVLRLKIYHKSHKLFYKRFYVRDYYGNNTLIFPNELREQIQEILHNYESEFKETHTLHFVGLSKYQLQEFLKLFSRKQLVPI